MKKSVLVVAAALLMVSPVAAQSSVTTRLPGTTIPSRQLPLKGTTSATSCAAYGPGFVKVEGTNSCMKIGGALSVGIGTGGTVGR
ncbi:MAG: hypothetical protein JOY90_31345 [Bradyrhizobium sp.]|uniref:hypothetical protein n=1 Tax=Bradyrhizobium sp. TaxID=376 RepID=UPI001DE8EFD0|nr:hypothetical protein [Bradyrhizobium sp.]MBV9564909.1 hypothetical protein [Bradyrhizobium sp.]